MGCCVSKNPTGQPPKPSVPTSSTNPLAEEAVKEVVLSETLPSPLPRSPAEKDDSPPVVVRPQPLLSPQVFVQTRTSRKLEQVADVVSEYSDIYRLSGSLSVSTTPTTGTAATLNDFEVTSNVSRRIASTRPNRVPRKRPPFVGGDGRPDRGSGSHVKKLQRPSPETRRRGSAPTERDLVGLRRNDGQSGSDPRLRSSFFSRDGIGKIPSKRTGSSSNRSSSSSAPGPPRCKKRFPEEDGSERHDNVGVCHDAAYESLYNPDVSLECFILL